MLFRIREEEDFFETNPQAKMEKGFRGASSTQMKFVAFYADWMSPYRNLPDNERLSRSLDASGLESEEGTEAYIDVYNDIQGIKEERESIDSIRIALNTVREKLRTSNDVDDLKKLANALAELLKQKNIITKAINEIMNIEDSSTVEEDGKSLIDDYRA